MSSSMNTRCRSPTAAPVRRYAAGIARRHPRLLWGALALHVLAALAALAAPRLLGDLVEAVEDGTTTAHVDRIILLLAGFLVAQTVLTRYARYVSQVLGEQVLAELREDFVGNTLALPVGVVESAGSGDLLTRTSRDVDQLGWSVRWALPEWTIAVVTAVLTFGAALSVGWWVALPCLLGVPAAGDRAALVPRPRQGRLPARERDVLRRSTRPSPRPSRAPAPSRRWASAEERIGQIDDDIAASFAAERYTLYLRTVFFPNMEIAYLIPTVLHAAVRRLALHPGLGVAGRRHGGDALRADADRPGRPDREHPRRAADGRRVAGPAARRRPGARRPRGQRRRSPGREARRRRTSGSPTSRVATSCTGSTSTSASGERIAMVGPSGAGKSTLGRLLAGIHPPRTGVVTVGGVGLVELALDDLRGHVALVTQEHHVFVGTLRENLALAAPPGAGDDEIRPSLDAVDALDWVDALPEGLDTVVGSGGRALTAAQAQQIALARLVLADPHTLVLDEATSLIDPRAARHLERSLAAVLARTHGDRHRAPALLGARRRPGRGRRGRRHLRVRLPRRAGGGRWLLRRAVGQLERTARPGRPPGHAVRRAVTTRYSQPITNAPSSVSPRSAASSTSARSSSATRAASSPRWRYVAMVGP